MSENGTHARRLSRQGGARPWTVVLLALALVLAAGCDDGQPADQDTGTDTGVDTGERDQSVDTTDSSAPDDTTSADDGPDGDTRISDGDATDTSEPPVHVWPLHDEPYTTLQAIWRPAPVPQTTKDMIADEALYLTDFERFVELGIFAEPAPGEPWQEQLELAPNWDPDNPPTGDRASLLYLWHVADTQLIDEESPIRFEGVYLAPFGSAYKPHSHVTTQVFESHVRTARRISELSGRPFDAALVSGDLVDGGQVNELNWFATILGGGTVDPDSGLDDDPVPGEGNDFGDPFASDGIGVPWYATIGNHEVLYSGFWHADMDIQAAAVGTEIIDVVERFLGFASGPGLRNGFRDGATVDAAVVDEGSTIADPDRHIATLQETMQILHDAPGEPAGHGFDADDVEAAAADFSFYPVPGKPIRIIGLSTLSQDPAQPDGRLEEGQHDWLVAQLDEARAANELVIISSHHGSVDFLGSSPVTRDEFQATLRSYDNVILHLTGHGHYNRKILVEGAQPGEGYWELMTGAVVDFPMQSRIVELVYEGDGWLTVYCTNIEQNAAPGTLADRARHWAVGRKIWFSSDYTATWANRASARNLILRYELPTAIAENLEAQTWPTRVESEETLLQLETPTLEAPTP